MIKSDYLFLDSETDTICEADEASLLHVTEDVREALQLVEEHRGSLNTSVIFDLASARPDWKVEPVSPELRDSDLLKFAEKIAKYFTTDEAEDAEETPVMLADLLDDLITEARALVGGA